MPETRAFAVELPGRSLVGTLDLPDLPGRRPTVVICHGFKGFQEWGFFPPLAELLAGRGFAVVRFNFFGSGMRAGDQRVTDLGAFRGATVGRDLEDLAAVFEALGRGVAAGRVDRDRVGLFGHSRGGGTALLAAASAELAPLVRALVTWSAVGTYNRFGLQEVAAWRARGELVIVNARTGQELPIGVEVLDDLDARRDEYDLAAAAARRVCPWLIVHGEDDETVAVSEAEALFAGAREPRRLLRIADASHTFGAQHPFAGPTPPLIEALNATQSWFRENL
jgi:dipeptidyl aminopeptidase/acylaminoacyl peptidase